MTVASCRVRGFLEARPSQTIKLKWPKETAFDPVTPLGSRPLTAAAADLLDLAGAVYRIERGLRGNQRTNRASDFDLILPVRDSGAWDQAARGAVAKALSLLGHANWKFDVKQTKGGVTQCAGSARDVDSVVLFSGGLDSAAGAAGLDGKGRVGLVSFFSKQRSLQADLATDLGFETPTQWTWRARLPRGRGRSFFYRSFAFLCLGAVTAFTRGCSRIIQFENGPLSLAIPPATAYLMTRHAHPALHEACGTLFSRLLGGMWTIENPFQYLSKRQAYLQMCKALTEPVAGRLAAKTESCWSINQARVRGRPKKPGRQCGVCVPCLVRRTALRDSDYVFDINRFTNRNGKLGLHFRSLRLFLDGVLRMKSEWEFLPLMDDLARETIEPLGKVPLRKVYDTYRVFANDFRGAFR